MPAVFARLAHQSDKELLAFVRTYGLPGQGLALTATERLLTTTRRDQWTELGASLDASRSLDEGDSVPWVYAHARTVALIIALHRALSRESDPAALTRILDKFGTGDVRATSLRIPAGVRGLTVEFTKERYSEFLTRLTVGRDPRRVARSRAARDESLAVALIVELMNLNVEGIRLELTASGTSLKQRFRPPNLMASIYLLLAQSLLGNKVRECHNPRCGMMFIATDERMLYCPPPLGVKGVSPCMNRHKVRRARDKRSKSRGSKS